MSFCRLQIILQAQAWGSVAEQQTLKPAIDQLQKQLTNLGTPNTFTTAKFTADKVFDKISRLEDHPEPGKRPLELINLNYREVNVNPCRIFYKVDSDKVYILHVMRQERDLRRFLLQS